MINKKCLVGLVVLFCFFPIFYGIGQTTRITQMLITGGAPIYGVEWNQGTDMWRYINAASDTLASRTRSDFDDFSPWRGMKRVNMAVDGTINAVIGDVGYTNDGTNGRVMVRIPKFFTKTNNPFVNVYQFWVSSKKFNATWDVHPAFKQSDGGAGVERDFIYIAAYEADGYLDVSFKLHSRTNETPVTGGVAYPDLPAGVFDLSAARTSAQNIGAGWEVWNVWEMSACRLLYYIEYKGANSQTAIGRGIVDKPSGAGFAGELTGVDNIDTEVGANGTGMGDGTDGLTPIAYRGIENLWGNVWKWVEGWNAVNGVVAANDVKYRVLKKDGTTTFADTLGTYDESPNYVHTGLPNEYQKNIEWNDGFELLFLPSGVSGGSSSYLYDYYYEHDNGETNILLFGGYWYSSVRAGVGFLSSSNVASYSHRAIGARLSFIL